MIVMINSLNTRPPSSYSPSRLVLATQMAFSSLRQPPLIGSSLRRIFTPRRQLTTRTSQPEKVQPLSRNNANSASSIPKRPICIAHTVAVTDTILPTTPGVYPTETSTTDIFSEEGKEAKDLIQYYTRRYPEIAGFVLPWHKRVSGGIDSVLEQAGVGEGDIAEYKEGAVECLAREIALRSVERPIRDPAPKRAATEFYEDEMRFEISKELWPKGFEKLCDGHEKEVRHVERML